MTPDIRPVTAADTAAFEALFGPQGACYGCWCTYFRLPPRVRAGLSAAAKREHMLARIAAGPPPGLLARVDGRPVGWMQIGPRSDVPEFNNRNRASTPLPDARADDPGVWAISCFFVARAARGLGLTQALVEAGIAHARAEGARLLEAAPMRRTGQVSSAGLYVGAHAVFQRAGFTEVACRKPGRPLMRLQLRPL